MIDIDNTVYLGSDGGKSCGTNVAKDSVENYPNEAVTYCFFVKNTGDSFLSSIVVVDDKLGFSTTIPMLAPGVATTIPFTSTITAPLENTAKVTANPTLPDGTDIPGQPDVTDSDNSSVGVIAYKPTVTISNVVYKGADKGDSCKTKGAELAQGYFNEAVVYCFNVTNTGNTYLQSVKLANNELKFSDD
jgi:hypothetical protein